MKTSFKVIGCMAALAVLVTVQSAAAQVKNVVLGKAAAQAKLQGVWKIAEVIISGPNARTVKPVENDIFIFTKKHFSSVMVASQKPRPALPQKDATDAQKLATWTPFTATAGTYEVKGTTLTAHPFAGKNPIEPGTLLVFDFKIEGGALFMTMKSNQDGPLPNPPTFKCVRVE